jgi:hypothetical protein
MRPVVVVVLTLCTLAIAGPASAGEPPRPVPENTLSLSLFALSSGGLAAQYERFVLPPRLSFATSLAVRRSGGRDFDVLDTAFGAEGRFWLSGRAPFGAFAGPAMVGPYLSVRVDYGIVSVSDDRHVLGATHTVAEAFTFGYRFSIAGVVHVTPSVGVGVRTELDPTGRLAPWTRAELVRLGLSAGVMW